MKDKNWSIHHEKLYNMLLKYYQTIDNIVENTFINDKKRYLTSIINNNSNWSDSTKESFFL